MSPDLKDIFDDAGRTPPHGRGYDADEVVNRGARIRTRRRVLTGAATLGVAAVVVGGSIALIGPGLGKGAAITPGDTAASASPSASLATLTPSPVPTTTPSGYPSDSPSGTPTADGPTPTPTGEPCTADDVTLTLKDGGVAAGTTYTVVQIKAKPGVVCGVAGFAFVNVVMPTGSPVRAAVNGSATEYVTVEGASVASFAVGIANSANYDQKVCQPVLVTTMNVTLPAPGDARETPLELLGSNTLCNGDVTAVGHQLSVTPIVSGADGQ
jgi:hypothetical protein